MKTIPLTQAKLALVDDQDYAWLNRWKWHAIKCTLKNRVIWYAVRTVNLGNCKFKSVRMHREIASIVYIPEVDHRDGNGLNNQRENLRPATQSQNQQNRHKAPGCSSKHKGVSWYRQTSRWQASIQKDGRRQHLGYFVNENDAAVAHNAAAKEAFGEFARVNKV